MELVEGDQLTITVALKGFGSENMTSLHMLKPSVTQETIEDTIVRAVSEAGTTPVRRWWWASVWGGDAELRAILARKHCFARWISTTRIPSTPRWRRAF